MLRMRKETLRMKSFSNPTSATFSLPALFLAALLCALPGSAQSATPITSPATTPAPATANPILDRPWEFGPVIQGGVGTGNRSSFSFFSAGVHLGKVLSPPALPGILHGQFELAGELFPLWQSYTPPPHLQAITEHTNGVPVTYYLPYGGGTFTG